MYKPSVYSGYNNGSNTCFNKNAKNLSVPDELLEFFPIFLFVGKIPYM